jgi:hypothetical protein
MANTIIFSSAFFRTVNSVIGEGPKKVRMNVTASFTKEVRDKMDWQEPVRPNGFQGRTIDEAAEEIDLEGELHARNMTLTPNEAELKGVAFCIDIAEVKNFSLVTVAEKESRRRELRFQIVSSSPGILAEIEKYTDVIGRGKGTLKISYVEQQDLDLKTETPAAADPTLPRATSEQRAAAEEIPVER